MPYNVKDYKSFIRSFIVSQVKKQNPDIDASPNSSFDDLYVKPVIASIDPIMDAVTSLEFNMDLNNAQLMDENELDKLAFSNFMLERNYGTKANCYMKISLSTIQKDMALIIPEGTLFQTSDNISFQTIARYNISYSELLSAYNPVSLTYDVTIYVEAVEVGEKYNVGENEITKSQYDFGGQLVSVTNPVPATSGTDKERNDMFAARIKEYYVSRHLGTHPGYKHLIKELCPEVSDSRVIGFREPEMIRDKVKVVLDSGETKEMHIGGKVDIYVKGVSYSSVLSQLKSKSRFLPLSTPYAIINKPSIIVTNLSTNAIVEGHTSEDLDGMFVLKLPKLEIDNLDDSLQEIAVNYTYQSGDITVPTTEYFVVGGDTYKLDSPVNEVTSVICKLDGMGDTEIESTAYNIIRVDESGQEIDELNQYYGTSKESSYIEIPSTVNTLNGSMFHIAYTVNSTVNTLKTHFDYEENRIITTDVMIKSCKPIPVNIGIRVKPRNMQSIGSVEASLLENSIARYFSELSLESSVQESDIISWLYKDQSVSWFIDYVGVPFQSFYVTDDISKPIEIKRDVESIQVGRTEYPMLNKILINEIK